MFVNKTSRHEKQQLDSIGSDVFLESPEYYKLAPSVEDDTFLSIMNEDCQTPRRRLPNNRQQVVNRLMSLRRTLLKKPEMKDHYIEFMDKIFSSGHAELALPLQPGQECWYLPSLGVYHPKKAGQIRIVFDSSSQHDNVSLNDVLLRGPDLNNSLLGILIRFRCEPIVIMADIQQMFHSFLVKKEQRLPPLSLV